ncbi:MAG: hypothetical protein ACOYMZ_03150 [Minisyncoccia bacterium]
MDPIEQNQSPLQQPLSTNPSAAVPEKKHFSSLWILLPLIILAVALFLFIGETNIIREGDEMMMPNTEDLSLMGDEPVPGAGETDEATAEESAAIRADLEASDTDGVSEGI